MTPGARIAAAIELFAEVERATAAADRVAQGWFRTRRYAGSKDRRAIIDLVFDALRQRGLGLWFAQANGIEASARLHVLGAVKLPLEEIESLMGSSAHAPEPLNEPERRFLLQGASGPMPPWARLNFPAWLSPYLERRFGASLEAEVGALSGRAPFDVRVNAINAQRDEVITLLGQTEIVAVPTALSPVGLRLTGQVRLENHVVFTQGMIEPQDEASQLACLLVDAKPGMQVIDYCAGAGGKTLGVAATMANKGQIYAHDSDRHRLERLKPRIQRAGVRNIQVVAPGSLKSGHLMADRVLVDAPCTGTGTWRRSPEQRWRLTADLLLRQTERQSALLREAASFVKPGGRLIFSTCSVLCEENEDRIEAFLADHADFVLLPMPEVWAGCLNTPCPANEPWLRLTPYSRGTDGFFVAVLQRKLEN